MISVGYPRLLPPHADRVLLDRKGDAWHRLPESIRRQLRERRDEIIAIRADIAKQAKVKVMPPVEITSDAWLSRDWEECVHAGAGVVEVGRAMQFGLKISGASTLLTSTAELRGLLLHGFNHCLWLNRHVLQAGVPPEGCRGLWLDCGMFDDERFEEACAERPDDWFGNGDARLFKWRARDLFPSGTNVIMHDWLMPGLPSTTAPSTYPPVIITIDPEIADRCEQLNARDPRQAGSPRWHQR